MSEGVKVWVTRDRNGLTKMHTNDPTHCPKGGEWHWLSRNEVVVQDRYPDIPPGSCRCFLLVEVGDE